MTVCPMQSSDVIVEKAADTVTDFAFHHNLVDILSLLNTYHFTAQEKRFAALSQQLPFLRILQIKVTFFQLYPDTARLHIGCP